MLADHGAAPASGPPLAAAQQFSFTVAPGWQVSGEIRLPAGPAPATVQVLVPGLTYDRRYWTMPDEYDYSAYMARAGYAVLTYDRLGTGKSTRPPADELTATAHADALHEIIRALRSGLIEGVSFERVVVVGHSYGSGIGIMEASAHHDIDGLIVSGMLHAFTDMHDNAREFFHSAAEDPLTAPDSPPPGYLTQKPGFRVRMLEHTPNVDPLMSEYNERIKSTGALGEGDTISETYLPSHSLAIDVPVFIAVGEHDSLFCGEAVEFGKNEAAVHAYESAFYSPAAKLETRVIKGSGHSLNLHRNAAEWFEIAREWIARQVG